MQLGNIFCTWILQVKAAFTRAYNKQVHLNPYSVTNTAKKGKKGKAAESNEAEFLGEHVAVEDEPSDKEEDVTADAMIKQVGQPRDNYACCYSRTTILKFMHNVMK